MPFILSGVCSPSEANYCSNPFEVFFSISIFRPFLEFAFDVFKEVIAEVIVETTINPKLGIEK